MFSEVNGDKIWWKVEKDSSMSIEYIDRNCIGKSISTKAVGSDEREDLTSSYKHKEGSTEEENVLEKVRHFGSRKEWTVKKVNRDIQVELGHETAIMGSEIKIPIQLTNTNTKSSRTVSLSAHIKCSAYTGRTDNKQPLIKTITNVLELSKKESDTLNISLLPEEYIKKIRSGSTLRMFLQLSVQETKQVYATQESFLVKKGTGVMVSCSKTTVKQYEEFDVTCTYTNTTSTKLTRSYFYLEGPGIRRSKKLYCGTIQPDSTIERTLTLSAYRVGERVLFVKFCNSKIPNAIEKVKIHVEEADPTEVI
jgi:hypothetical protein